MVFSFIRSLFKPRKKELQPHGRILVRTNWDHWGTQEFIEVDVCPHCNKLGKIQITVFPVGEEHYCESCGTLWEVS